MYNFNMILNREFPCGNDDSVMLCLNVPDNMCPECAANEVMSIFSFIKQETDNTVMSVDDLASIIVGLFDDVHKGKSFYMEVDCQLGIREGFCDDCEHVEDIKKHNAECEGGKEGCCEGKDGCEPCSGEGVCYEVTGDEYGNEGSKQHEVHKHEFVDAARRKNDGKNENPKGKKRR